MNQPAAWEYLGNLWLKATNYSLSRQTPHIMPHEDKDAYPAFGLCQSVFRLGFYHKVSEKVYDLMTKRLNKHLQSVGWTGAYIFDLDAEGSRQRAELCARFAAEFK